MKKLIGKIPNYSDEAINKISSSNKLTNLLDKFFGLKIVNELIVADTESKAMVSGTVTLLGDISYSTLVELCDWDEDEQAWRLKAYKDLLIKAPTTICTVVFNLENGDQPIVTTIQQGTSLTAIAKPTKPSEIDKVFKFSHWTEANAENFEDGFTITVKTDLVFTAKYTYTIREYTVKFISNSNIISVLPTETKVAYGNTVPIPTITGIPDGVELNCWIGQYGRNWNFTISRVESDTVLTAQWKDSNEPSINLTVLDATTIEYAATDNLGIAAWGVTVNSDTQPEVWTWLDTPAISYSDNFTVTESGLHIFWIKDVAGHTASAEVQVYTVGAETMSEGINSYKFYFYDLENVKQELLTLNVKF